MSKYYHDIIRYFFHHQASEEIIDRVQKRILHSQDDADDVMREIWERLDACVCVADLLCYTAETSTTL